MRAARKRQDSRKATRKKVRAHRARLRAQGLRPIQIWAPDVRAPGFAEEASRQSRLAAESPDAADDQAFVDAVSAIKF
ncbi:MAG: antitoxin MazE family protein [Methylocystis sp.]|nr:antitoxin MazE family protein [Methylocystis sp.]